MINFVEILKLTLYSPRSILNDLNNLKITRLRLIEALVFVTCLSTLVTFLSLYLQIWIYRDTTLDVDPIFLFFSRLPILLVIVQIIAISFFSFLITIVGKFFSGKSDFFTIFRFVIWINFVLVLINILQLVMILISIQLSSLIGIISTFWSLWAISALTAESHGFKSTSLTAFIGAIVLIFVFLVLVILLQLSGLVVFEEIINV